VVEHARSQALSPPHAYVEIGISVDEAPGIAGAFVEIDFATMDQARLRAKVARHRAYASDGAWWTKHPGCPVLLLLTTSEARATRFLSTVERDKPKPSIWEQEDSTHPDGLIAACASVASPEEALSAPVWRMSAADAPMLLSSVLAGEVDDRLPGNGYRMGALSPVARPHEPEPHAARRSQHCRHRQWPANSSTVAGAPQRRHRPRSTRNSRSATTFWILRSASVFGSTATDGRGSAVAAARKSSPQPRRRGQVWIKPRRRPFAAGRRRSRNAYRRS
jgi:hypothetical protein